MVATLLSTLVLGAQSGVTLKFQPPLHRPYRYQMVMDMQQAIPGVGPMGFKTVTDMVMTAVSRKGSQTTVQTKITRVKVTVPPKSPMAGMKDQMEKSMTGKTISYVMGSDFKIVSAAAGGSMMQGFGAMGALSVPSHPLKVGETWSSSVDFSKIAGTAAPGMQMSGKIPVRLKLVSVSGGVARIATTMAGSTTVKAGGMNMQMTMNAKGTSALELSTGMMVQVQMTSDTTTHVGQQQFKQHAVMTMRRQ